MMKNILRTGICVLLTGLLMAGALPLLAFAEDENRISENTNVSTDSEDTALDPDTNPSNLLAEDDATLNLTLQDNNRSSMDTSVGKSFDDNEITYTVKFYDWDEETLLGSFEVREGDTSPTPMPPIREDHVFIKWDKDITNVSRDLDVYAVYREMKIFTIVIQYLFTNGEAAEQSYRASVQEDASFTETVTSPTVAGYTPNFESITIDIASVTQDALYTVTYSRSHGIPYKVIHHFEKLDSSGYENPVTETFRGMNGDMVIAQENHYSGFTAQDGDRQGVISSDGSLELNIYYDRNTVALYFDATGGSYLEPLSGRFGEQVDYSDYVVPQRDGFDFVKWDKTLPTAFPENDMTVFAVWEEYAEAPVTIIYWIEDASTGNFWVASVDTSQVFATGSQPNFNEFHPPYSDERGYVGFPWNTGVTSPELHEKYYPKNVEKTFEANKDVMVTSDGSTTYNIYHNLATISYVFSFPGTLEHSNRFLRYEGDDVYLDIGGIIHGSEKYVITAKYSTYLGDIWPSSSQLGRFSEKPVEELRPYGWCIGASNNVYRMNQNVSGISARWLEEGQMGDDMRMPLYLWVDNTGKEMVTITIEHYHQKVRAGTDQTSDYTFASSEKKMWTVDSEAIVSPKLGFTSITVPDLAKNVTRALLPFVEGAVYQVYHNRAQYDVVFHNCDMPESKRVSGIWFTDALSNYPECSFTPTPPADKKDCLFSGWFSSPYYEPESKVDLTSVSMPAADLLLYAKWEAPKYKVSFNLNGGTGKDDDQFITSGGYIAPYDEPVREGYVFAGWKEGGSNVKFRLNNPVVRDLHLVASWIPERSAEYTVYFREYGTSANLASSETIRGVTVGSSQTATAKIIEKYVPDSVSKSITISSQGNALIFFYKPFVSGTYQVRYETVEGEQLLMPVTKTTYNSYVTENHIPIRGYYPLEAQLPLQMSQDITQNVIVFRYALHSYAPYTVNYYQQQLDWSYKLAGSEQHTAETGSFITVSVPTYPGFSYNKSLSSASGVVSSDGSLELKLYYGRFTHSVRFTTSEGGRLSGVTDYPGILDGTVFSGVIRVPTPEPEDGYRFSGWTPELPPASSLVTADAVYTAHFTTNMSTAASDAPVEATLSLVAPETPGLLTTEQSASDPLELLHQLLSGEIPIIAFDGWSWSLVNLILASFCTIVAAVLLIRSLSALRKTRSRRYLLETDAPSSLDTVINAEHSSGVGWV